MFQQNLSVQQPQQQIKENKLHNDGSSNRIECDRCMEPLKSEDLHSVMFADKSELVQLCIECYEIVRHSASPNSWKFTDSEMEEAKKQYYFSKKRDQ